MDINNKKATRQSYGEALLELGKENEKVVVFDADLSAATKTNLFAKEFPERFFDMGIAEQNMISTAAGISTGQAMDHMEKLVNKHAPEYSIAWNGVSFQEKQASANSLILYSISLLFVFLCLAALYESWSIPFAVMLVVPLGIVGAIGAAYISQIFPGLFSWTKPLENDVYFQVGLLTTIGLSAKNAILIVEFAKELYDKGHRLTDSVVEASNRWYVISNSSGNFLCTYILCSCHEIFHKI